MPVRNQGGRWPVPGRPSPAQERKPHSGIAHFRRAPDDRRRGTAKRLSELAQAIGASCSAESIVTGISADSRRVRPGDLFVAATGDRDHIGQFIDDACSRGATGIVAPNAVAAMPSIEVADPRAALPQLAAAFHDHPADRLTLVGVTGTLGKTSTTLLLRSILEASGRTTGVVGSLGIKLKDVTRDTGITTPDAGVLQEALHWFADEGASHVAMEVTSHGLAQNRVDGLHFGLGILTNLVPDEHLEYHPTPEHYLDTKMRFLRFLEPTAPLVINADCALSVERTRDVAQPLVAVSSTGDPDAAVQVSDLRVNNGASEFALRIAEAAAPGALAPGLEIVLRLPFFGATQVHNAAMAATAALLLGASPRAVQRGLQTTTAIQRRMEVIRPARPMVIDDTVGNPLSLAAVFHSLAHIPVKGRVRILFGIRGMRGSSINARLAETLAEGIKTVPAEVVVTASEGFADGRNRVLPEERDAFLGHFREHTAGHFEASLQGAVERLLDGVGEDDLVLLLGAQGLDSAARLVREKLGDKLAA